MVQTCIITNCGASREKDGCSLFKAPDNVALRKQWEAAIPGAMTLGPTSFVCDKHFPRSAITRSYMKRRRNGRFCKIPSIRATLSRIAIPSIFDDQPQNPETEALEIADDKQPIATQDYHARASASLDSEKIHEKPLATLPPMEEVAAAFNDDCTALLDSICSTDLFKEKPINVLSSEADEWLAFLISTYPDINEKPIDAVRSKEKTEIAERDDKVPVATSNWNIGERCVDTVHSTKRAATSEDGNLFDSLPLSCWNTEEIGTNAAIEAATAESRNLFHLPRFNSRNIHEERVNTVPSTVEATIEENSNLFPSLPSTHCNIAAVPTTEGAGVAENSYMFPSLPSSSWNINGRNTNAILASEEAARIEIAESGNLFASLPLSCWNTDERGANVAIDGAATAESGNLSHLPRLNSRNIHEERVNTVPSTEGANIKENSNLFPSLPSTHWNIAAVPTTEGAGVAENSYMFPSLPSSSWNIDGRHANAILASEKAATAENGNKLASLPSSSWNMYERYFSIVPPMEEAATVRNGNRRSSLPSGSWNIYERCINVVPPMAGAAAANNGNLFPSLPSAPWNIHERCINVTPPREEAATAKNGNLFHTPLSTRSNINVRRVNVVSPLEGATTAKNDNRRSSRLWTPWNTDERSTNVVSPIEGTATPKNNNPRSSRLWTPWNVDERSANVVSHTEGAATTENDNLFSSLSSSYWNIGEECNKVPLQTGVGTATAKIVNSLPCRALLDPNMDEKSINADLPAGETAITKNNNAFPSLTPIDSTDCEKSINTVPPTEVASTSVNDNLFRSLSSPYCNIEGNSFKVPLQTGGTAIVKIGSPLPCRTSLDPNMDEKSINTALPAGETAITKNNNAFPSLTPIYSTDYEKSINTVPPTEGAATSENDNLFRSLSSPYCNIEENSFKVPLQTGGTAIVKIGSPLPCRTSLDPNMDEKSINTALPAGGTAITKNNDAFPSLTSIHSTDCEKSINTVPPTEETPTAENDNPVQSSKPTDFATDSPSTEYHSSMEVDSPRDGNESPKLSTLNEGQTNTSQNMLKLTLPKSWSFVATHRKNQQQWIFSKVVTNRGARNTPVINKSVVIDHKNVVRYYVHGMMVQRYSRQLPQTIADLKAIATILRRFEASQVCEGLGRVTASHPSYDAMCKDHMNRYRAKSCWLIVEIKRPCDCCLKLKKLRNK